MQHLTLKYRLTTELWRGELKITFQILKKYEMKHLNMDTRTDIKIPFTTSR